MGAERGIENEIESEIDHENLLETTIPSPPATRLRGPTRKLGGLPRRPSGGGPIRYEIRGERIPRHPNTL